MPGIVGPLLTSVADNRPKQTFIPHRDPRSKLVKPQKAIHPPVVKGLGSKQKRTYSIGDKNKEIKKQGTKFIPK